MIKTNSTINNRTPRSKFRKFILERAARYIKLTTSERVPAKYRAPMRRALCRMVELTDGGGYRSELYMVAYAINAAAPHGKRRELRRVWLKLLEVSRRYDREANPYWRTFYAQLSAFSGSSGSRRSRTTRAVRASASPQQHAVFRLAA